MFPKLRNLTNPTWRMTVCQQERRRLLTVILCRSQHGVNQYNLCHPPTRPIDPKLFCRDSLLKTIPLKDFSFFYADNDSNAQTRRVCCGVRRRRAVECTASSPTDPVQRTAGKMLFCEGVTVFNVMDAE